MKSSLGLLFWLMLLSAVQAQTSKEIGMAANQFIESLSKEELRIASLTFEDTSRTRWTNLPVGLQKRAGIRYGRLSDQAKISFHHYLTTILSSQGYLKATSIMALDDILNILYKDAYDAGELSDEVYLEIRSLNWDFTNYFIAVYGKLQTDKVWGIKLEGHHISLNLTVNGDSYSLTPLFLGTDPAEVSSSKYAGIRVLSKEEDYGLKLINSLSPEQQKVATLSVAVPRDILTNPESSQRLDSYQGIKASDLNESQKEILFKLIGEYINNLESQKASTYFDKMKASGMDQIYFAWIGSYEIRKPNYYVIHSPDFIIEFDNYGFNNDGNHIHSIWREKGNDFGEDILRSHYLQDKH